MTTHIIGVLKNDYTTVPDNGEKELSTATKNEMDLILLISKDIYELCVLLKDRPLLLAKCQEAVLLIKEITQHFQVSVGN